MYARDFERILQGVRAWGYRERSFALVSEGRWTAKDAEWNYLDVPHLNEVHSQADAETLFYTDTTTSSILLQRVGPVKFATVLTIFVSKSDELSYASSVGPFLMLVRSQWQDQSVNFASVRTEYHIFASRGLGWLLPIVERLLCRNYKILMSEDLPLRERKGQLRDRGIRFSHDSMPHSFLDSRFVGRDNVLLPQDADEIAFEVRLSDLAPGEPQFLGSDDHRGLRVERVDNSIVLAPRMCMHEGACLDSVPLNGKTLRCPWHGRGEKLLGRIDLDSTSSSIDNGTLKAGIENDRLFVVIRTRGEA